MDNLTHSLAGLLIAESAHQLRHRGVADNAPRDGRVATLAMIAANLPDADLFYTGAGGDPLSYILHHRGYTHTVVLAVAGALLLWAIGMRWRRVSPAAAEPATPSGWLLGTMLVGTLSHLLLDWTNSYGVHPFWPWNSRWFYGDAVFIVEPWLWVVSVPALFAAVQGRLGRVSLGLVLVIAVVLPWIVPFIAWKAAAVLTLGALVMCASAWRLRGLGRTGAAVGAWVLVTLVMAAGTRSAQTQLRAAVASSDASVQLLDVILSPQPTNPTCVTAISVERAGDTYRVVTAQVSAVPALVDAAACRTATSPDASLTPTRRPSTRGVHWVGEWMAPVASLQALSAASCPAAAALRFYRAPVWRPDGDGQVVIGDARFGGAASGQLSVRVPAPSRACPRAVPPWVPPRADLLGAGAAR